ncbi:AraC family transcriptional regulator [Aliidiomarina celeris]|uniref:AraC family transcriptional regulator n=1 Tax=Aliidiomarina celeris TaxID=2249428 RepID=UPI001300423A|nr:AraC family transcriptional regulator [Aliidiomarina celeris]
MSISTVSFSFQRALLIAAHEAKLLQFDDATWQRRFSAATERVSLEEQNHLWRTLAEHPRADALVGAFAEHIDPAELGELGYALASCPNLGYAIELLQRYHAFIGDGGSLHLSQNNGLQLDYVPHYQEAQQLRVQTVLICIVALAKKLTGQRIGHIQVGLTRPPSKAVCRYFKRLTGNEPHLAHTNHVWFSTTTLKLPLVTANARLLAILLTNLEEQERGLHSKSTAQFVSHCLRENPRLQRKHIAARLHCTERTLVRRLSKEFTTFKQLKTAAQKCEAQLLLANPELSLECVAEQLGYTDASAFIKAYRLWFGRTPKGKS